MTSYALAEIEPCVSITKIILWRLQYKVGKDQLQAIAHEAMLQRGLLPDFSADSRSRLHRRSGGSGSSR